MFFDGIDQCKTYPMDAIVSMTAETLSYRDDAGEIQTIHFSECRRNWAEDFNAHAEEFVSFDGTPATPCHPAECRCVGARNWFEKKPFYVFWTNERIRFELRPQKRWIDRLNRHWRHHRYYKTFRVIEDHLREQGMTTFGLG